MDQAPLKLRAVDADDLAVLGACLQDALVPVCDMCFIPEESRFVLVANRFCWERVPEASKTDETPVYERILCGITFENVKKTQFRGFSPIVPENQGDVLEVLDIQAENGALTLIFAGGAGIRLETGAISVYAEDMGESWPTLWQPRHESEDGVDQDGGTR